MRFTSLKLPTLLCVSAFLVCAGAARAQEDAGVAPPATESPSHDAGSPNGVGEDQDRSEAPPVLLTLPVSTASGHATATPESSSSLERANEAATQVDDGEPEVASVPGDPWGDADGLSLITLRALMQFRYVGTFASESRHELISGREKEEFLAQDGDGYTFNKLLVRLSSDPSRYVGFKTVLDFANLISNDPEDVVKQAYAVLRPVPERLEFLAGMFKVPFSVLELDPSSRYEFAQFGPANRLANDLGFAGRDLGVQVMLAPLKKPKRLRLSLGAFRGHSYDEHDSPVGSLAGRAETKPSKWLRLGGDIVQHFGDRTYNRPFETSDREMLPNPPDPLHPMQRNWAQGRAYSADLRIKKKGAMLRGEFMYFDRVDLDERYDAKSAWSAWGLLAYRIDAGSVKLLPAIRAEWLDADREHDKGLWRTLSASFTLLFLERVRLLIDVTRTDVQANTPVIKQPKPLQVPPFMALDSTRVTGQLQIEL